MQNNKIKEIEILKKKLWRTDPRSLISAKQKFQKDKVEISEGRKLFKKKNKTFLVIKGSKHFFKIKSLSNSEWEEKNLNLSACF